MSEGLVTGFFDDQEHAANAIEALRTRKFDPGSLSVVGCDCDQFRNVIAPLVSKSADRFALVGSIIGVVIGTIAGFYAVRELQGFVYFLAIGPLMAAISGAVAGGIIGLILGGLTHFDTVQYDAAVCNTVDKSNKVVLSVKVKDKDELDIAEAIMQERGALEVHTKLAPIEAEASKQKKEQVHAEAS